ncbi:MAG: phosphotransferase [Actinomycetota bacterium]|nr:phosphotransferase [Actinomycetota bacterium]
MRTFPESASLDHLRRQAKDLLVLLRRSQQSATLADAQTAVAREYGYKSWTQLKVAAEEQRAAQTEIAAAELVDALVDRYGLGRVTGTMRRIERTWAGHVWEVEATGGRVVLTELFDYVRPEDIEVEAGLVEHAIASGISAPAPIRTTAGAVIASLNGSNWRAHHWVRLGPAPTKPPSPRTAAAAGRVLATLHTLALPAQRPVVRWLTHRRPEQAWRALVDQARSNGAAWAEALAEAVPGFVTLDAVRDERDPNARAVLSHACLSPDVVRIAGRDEILVLGWEHASAIPPDWELGDALRAWSEGSDLELGAAAARSLLNAYRELVDGPHRLELSMFASSVTALLNWIASRVQIALTGDDQQQRELASRNLPALLENPISLPSIQRLVDTLS